MFSLFPLIVAEITQVDDGFVQAAKGHAGLEKLRFKRQEDGHASRATELLGNRLIFAEIVFKLSCCLILAGTGGIS